MNHSFSPSDLVGLSLFFGWDTNYCSFRRLSGLFLNMLNRITTSFGMTPSTINGELSTGNSNIKPSVVRRYLLTNTKDLPLNGEVH